MTQEIRKLRVVALKDVETLAWLSSRCRHKLKSDESKESRRKYKRLLMALNRHLTQLANQIKQRKKI